jgi:hypothetical protein
MDAEPTLQEILEDIRTKPTVPLWPHVGTVLGISRGSTYAAARRGDFELLEVGRLKRAISAPLRKRLGLNGG